MSLYCQAATKPASSANIIELDYRGFTSENSENIYFWLIKLSREAACLRTFIPFFAFLKMLELPILAIYVTCIAGMITAATRKRDKRPPWERENGKEEIGNWLAGFLAKLKRTSSRTEKCRLISSVERITFEDNRYAAVWQHVQFGEDEAEIFWSESISLQKIKLTEFQKMILNLNLKNVMISRSEIIEENGDWEIEAELKKKLLSKGGEAMVFSEEFENLETAVRLQIFDPFVFTKDFGLDSISWKIHFEKGYNFFGIFEINF